MPFHTAPAAQKLNNFQTFYFWEVVYKDGKQTMKEVR